ncbi:MAG: GNAT family N-acetyltransferase [Actinobacteria bacterium]|nr:GNAT family N-acetyltransferase [Actinomycetota bacterium]
MDGVKCTGSPRIEVVALTPELKEQAVETLVQAFKTEETTVYHLDTENPSTLKRMAVLDGLFVRLYLEAGRTVLAAMIDGCVAGVGMVRDPRIHLSKIRVATLSLPNFHQLVLLYARRPLRFLRVMWAAKSPKDLTKPHFTFEVLGIHPDHQGRGAGKELMREVQAMVEDDPTISGIYLNTGSERNQSFYESLDYDTLRIVDLKAVKIYHMFWRNPAFG